MDMLHRISQQTLSNTCHGTEADNAS